MTHARRAESVHLARGQVSHLDTCEHGRGHPDPRARASAGLETGIPLREAEPLLLASIFFTLFAAVNEVRNIVCEAAWPP